MAEAATGSGGSARVLGRRDRRALGVHARARHVRRRRRAGLRRRRRLRQLRRAGDAPRSPADSGVGALRDFEGVTRRDGPRDDQGAAADVGAHAPRRRDRPGHAAHARVGRQARQVRRARERSRGARRGRPGRVPRPARPAELRRHLLPARAAVAPRAVASGTRPVPDGYRPGGHLEGGARAASAVGHGAREARPRGRSDRRGRGVPGRGLPRGLGDLRRRGARVRGRRLLRVDGRRGRAPVRTGRVVERRARELPHLRPRARRLDVRARRARNRDGAELRLLVHG